MSVGPARFQRHMQNANVALAAYPNHLLLAMRSNLALRLAL